VSENQLYIEGMILEILVVVTLISCPVHGSLPLTDHEYPLMNYTKVISEEYFSVGLPLAIVLPVAEESTTNGEVGYLIKELHTSGRWPILVYNVGYDIERNMYTEIHQDGNYIIQISGPCVAWELYKSRFSEQLNILIFGKNRKHSCNPRAKFVVPVILNCTEVENRNISSKILGLLSNYEVTKIPVYFLNSNEHSGYDLKNTTSPSAQGTYLELHTWCPHENSERCIPATRNVPVKVFTVRNLSDIMRSDIFRGHFDNNFHVCPIIMSIREWEWKHEFVKLIGKTLNMTRHSDLTNLSKDEYIMFGRSARKIKNQTRCTISMNIHTVTTH
jgi:hypothetical protein